FLLFEMLVSNAIVSTMQNAPVFRSHLLHPFAPRCGKRNCHTTTIFGAEASFNQSLFFKVVTDSGEIGGFLRTSLTQFRCTLRFMIRSVKHHQHGVADYRQAV